MFYILYELVYIYTNKEVRVSRSSTRDKISENKKHHSVLNIIEKETGNKHKKGEMASLDLSGSVSLKWPSLVVGSRGVSQWKTHEVHLADPKAYVIT